MFARPCCFYYCLTMYCIYYLFLCIPGYFTLCSFLCAAKRGSHNRNQHSPHVFSCHCETPLFVLFFWQPKMQCRVYCRIHTADMHAAGWRPAFARCISCHVLYVCHSRIMLQGNYMRAPFYPWCCSLCFAFYPHLPARTGPVSILLVTEYYKHFCTPIVAKTVVSTMHSLKK